MSYRITMHEIDEETSERGQLLSEDWIEGKPDADAFARELRDEAVSEGALVTVRVVKE